jgi:hypothetical protein
VTDVTDGDAFVLTVGAEIAKEGDGLGVDLI